MTSVSQNCCEDQSLIMLCKLLSAVRTEGFISRVAYYCFHYTSCIIMVGCSGIVM